MHIGAPQQRQIVHLLVLLLNHCKYLWHQANTRRNLHLIFYAFLIFRQNLLNIVVEMQLDSFVAIQLNFHCQECFH
jgi:hypothetical protein